MSRRPLVIPPHHASEDMRCATCRQEEWPCDTFKTAKLRAERTPQLSRPAVIGEKR